MQAEFPVIYSIFPLAIYFTRGSVYMSMLLSQFVPLLLSPTVSTHIRNEYYSDIKSNEIEPVEVMWMDLEPVIQSKLN